MKSNFIKIDGVKNDEIVLNANDVICVTKADKDGKVITEIEMNGTNRIVLNSRNTVQEIFEILSRVT